MSPSKKTATPKKPGSSKGAPSVEEFLAALEHPFKSELLALRTLILGVDPAVSEEIKWNAPSFRTTDHFATFQLRAPGCVQVILHFGAKKRELPELSIRDPEKLLEWLAPDRASVRFANLAEIRARGRAFQELLQSWIRYV